MRVKLINHTINVKITIQVILLEEPKYTYRGPKTWGVTLAL